MRDLGLGGGWNNERPWSWWLYTCFPITCDAGLGPAGNEERKEACPDVIQTQSLTCRSSGGDSRRTAKHALTRVRWSARFSDLMVSSLHFGLPFFSIVFGHHHSLSLLEANLKFDYWKQGRRKNRENPHESQNSWTTTNQLMRLLSPFWQTLNASKKDVADICICQRPTGWKELHHAAMLKQKIAAKRYAGEIHYRPRSKALGSITRSLV
ncbi:hypothetical protein ACLOJK_040003 [Asimina triloba]